MGYRFGDRFAGFTPYAAAQAQTFRTPSYGETAISGSSQFALSYDARTSTATRTELGYWLDSTVPLAHGGTLSWRGRAAWANNTGDRKAAATFQALPGASFTVLGAEPPTNLMLLSAGTELQLSNGVSLGARFDGEVSTRAQTYSGTGTVRYVW
ncbi:MAG: autotransporter domain-containing protein [Xanthobacteraceae bacterium]|nr:autotransporter domain-containing protein [Xanthobacteraceae bacterium]